MMCRPIQNFQDVGSRGSEIGGSALGLAATTGRDRMLLGATIPLRVHLEWVSTQQS